MDELIDDDANQLPKKVYMKQIEMINTAMKRQRDGREDRINPIKKIDATDPGSHAIVYPAVRSEASVVRPQIIDLSRTSQHETESKPVRSHSWGQQLQHPSRQKSAFRNKFKAPSGNEVGFRVPLTTEPPRTEQTVREKISIDQIRQRANSYKRQMIPKAKLQFGNRADHGAENHRHVRRAPAVDKYRSLPRRPIEWKSANIRGRHSPRLARHKETGCAEIVNGLMNPPGNVEPADSPELPEPAPSSRTMAPISERPRSNVVSAAARDHVHNELGRAIKDAERVYKLALKAIDDPTVGKMIGKMRKSLNIAYGFATARIGVKATCTMHLDTLAAELRSLLSQKSADLETIKYLGSFVCETIVEIKKALSKTGSLVGTTTSQEVKSLCGDLEQALRNYRKAKQKLLRSPDRQNTGTRAPLVPEKWRDVFSILTGRIKTIVQQLIAALDREDEAFRSRHPVAPDALQSDEASGQRDTLDQSDHAEVHRLHHIREIGPQKPQKPGRCKRVTSALTNIINKITKPLGSALASAWEWFNNYVDG